MSTPAQSPLLTGLALVIAPDTRILILGSFPGAASLAAQQYYAHLFMHDEVLFSVYLKRALNPREIWRRSYPHR